MKQQNYSRIKYVRAVNYSWVISATALYYSRVKSALSIDKALLLLYNQ